MFAHNVPTPLIPILNSIFHQNEQKQRIKNINYGHTPYLFFKKKITNKVRIASDKTENDQNNLYFTSKNMESNHIQTR